MDVKRSVLVSQFFTCNTGLLKKLFCGGKQTMLHEEADPLLVINKYFCSLYPLFVMINVYVFLIYSMHLKKIAYLKTQISFLLTSDEVEPSRKFCRERGN